MSERWTTDDVMRFRGLKTRESVRDWLSTHGIPAIGRQPGRSGLNEYDADTVRRVAAGLPGQGVGGGRPRKQTAEQ